MSETNSQDIRDLTEQIHDLNLTMVKLQSHLESELGENTRQLNNAADQIKAINHKIFGNGKEGILIKLDRLEQASQSRKKWEKGFIGATCVLVIKIAFDVVKAFPAT